MHLYRHSLTWYHLRIETDAEAVLLEVSFDGGTTWLPGEPTLAGWRWRIAGPLAEAPPAGTTVISADIRPLLRMTTSDGVKPVQPSDVAINLKD